MDNYISSVAVDGIWYHIWQYRIVLELSGSEEKMKDGVSLVEVIDLMEKRLYESEKQTQEMRIQTKIGWILAGAAIALTFICYLVVAYYHFIM